MKKLFILTSIGFALAACGGSTDSTQSTESSSAATTQESTASTENPSYDPKRGEGKFDHVELGASLDAAMATKGEEVSGVKCSSCHKTTSEKLVGPGWEGVTKRRAPEWIMNFITNPDPMIDKDPEVQAQLEICLVRMPNQGLSDDEARNILEYMRKIDGVN
jgi:mono/diheme cytochrome c family protein